KVSASLLSILACSAQYFLSSSQDRGSCPPTGVGPYGMNPALGTNGNPAPAFLSAAAASASRAAAASSSHRSLRASHDQARKQCRSMYPQPATAARATMAIRCQTLSRDREPGAASRQTTPKATTG